MDLGKWAAACVLWNVPRSRGTHLLGEGQHGPSPVLRVGAPQTQGLAAGGLWCCGLQMQGLAAAGCDCGSKGHYGIHVLGSAWCFSGSVRADSGPRVEVRLPRGLLPAMPTGVLLTCCFSADETGPPQPAITWSDICLLRTFGNAQFTPRLIQGQMSMKTHPYTAPGWPRICTFETLLHSTACTAPSSPAGASLSTAETEPGPHLYMQKSNVLMLQSQS